MPKNRKLGICVADDGGYTVYRVLYSPKNQKKKNNTIPFHRSINETIDCVASPCSLVIPSGNNKQTNKQTIGPRSSGNVEIHCLSTPCPKPRIPQIPSPIIDRFVFKPPLRHFQMGWHSVSFQGKIALLRAALDFYCLGIVMERWEKKDLMESCAPLTYF